MMMEAAHLMVVNWQSRKRKEGAGIPVWPPVGTPSNAFL